LQQEELPTASLAHRVPHMEESMKSFKALLLIAAIGLNGIAFAASADYMEAAKKVDAAMASGKFSPSTTDEARKLRADSDRMMKEGKEAEAMKLLEKVKELLNIK
jgi:hypothetical protein